ncbi:LuxR family transcriptional regulator [Kribbella turkmenica]|uniref:LuxR family transcriptional regulator n=1 Tax=Kribbella turkmenica TaxID=2530375 RepID=A0A4R4XHL6_9ACTN|nr:helix-turn-helix transcriptional regulator [Kribbella turkmenica]TDD30336.1 LuxR family transcriptional regulator [Kribbella turkmenica]
MDLRLLERQADQCAEAGDYAASLALRERAFAHWRERGDLRRAAYLAAYQIAFDHLAFFGNQAVAQGWIERATHLAEQAGDCAEAGWVALSRVLYTADPAVRAELVDEATRLAQRFGDNDLRFDALAFAGLALVEEGRVSEGMRQLDEAAAAARGGEVTSPVVAGEIYCKLLVACESTLDVRRAEDWQRVTSPLGDRPAVAWASAICRTHYGGILVVAGRWDEAEHELEESLRLYDASYRALRSAALARLAELRVRQGRLSECRELLAGQAVDAYALRPWARTEWLTAGDAAERGVVAARLERALGRQGRGLLDVPVMALLTEMQVACGDVSAATRTARTMVELTASDPVEALVGYARQSNACVAAAAAGGRSGSGLDGVVEELESAIASFAAAQLPLEAACARLRLAELVQAEDPALARAEARTAAESCAWLGANLELDRATALLRTLGGPARTGVRRVGSLTDRETEVLALVSQGLSNPQIAERLYISPKTASHHVSNVLAKLGVQNRAEAAAWAAAHGRTGRR